MARTDLSPAAGVDGDVRRRSVQSTAMARLGLGFLQRGKKEGERESRSRACPLFAKGGQGARGSQGRPRVRGGHGASVLPGTTVMGGR